MSIFHFSFEKDTEILTLKEQSEYSNYSVSYRVDQPLSAPNLWTPAECVSGIHIKAAEDYISLQLQEFSSTVL